MATIEEFFKQAEDRAAGGGPAPGTGSPAAPGLPVGVQQIIDQVIPMIERGTGKSMDKIIVGAAAAMGKGQLEEYFKNLIPGGIGKSETPLARKDQKWLDYAKFVIFWGPVAVLGFGGAVLVLIYLSRFVVGG
jgi:hypothetical protein